MNRRELLNQPMKVQIAGLPNIVRRAVEAKALLRVQFLLTFFGGRGEEQEASALLRKKGGRGL